MTIISRSLRTSPLDTLGDSASNRSNKMPNEPSSAIIVGGGVIGLFSALEILKSGVDVTILEAEPADGNNCSLGNAGMIVPSHFIPLAAPGVLSKGLLWMLDRESPFYVKPRISLELARWGWWFCLHANARHVAASRDLLCRLNLESRSLFGKLAEEGDFGWTTRGLLMLCESTKALEEEAEIAHQACELGLNAKVLDPAAAANIDPDIEMKIAGAIHFGDDAHLDPGRLIEFLRTKIQQLGGRIIYDSPVERIETQAGKVTAVTSPKGRFSADQFIIAGGSWSPGLLRQTGLRIPLQAGKGYSLTLPDPVQVPRLCSILTEAKVAVTPIGRQLRFAGTMEIGGINQQIDPRRVKGIIKAACRYFPRFKETDFDHIKVWSGLRPVSPDGLPYLGKSPNFDNLTIATGHAMMGLSLAPVTGKLVSELLRGQADPNTLTALRPDRFS